MVRPRTGGGGGDSAAGSYDGDVLGHRRSGALGHRGGDESMLRQKQKIQELRKPKVPKTPKPRKEENAINERR